MSEPVAYFKVSEETMAALVVRRRPTIHQGPKESEVFARKVQVHVLSPGAERPCPLAWLDSYSMRSFTGRSAFDEILPVADGLLEASFRVDLEALRSDMEDWMTRKFGEGQPVTLRLTEG